PNLSRRTQAVKEERFRLSPEWLPKYVDRSRLDATRYLIDDGAAAGQYDTPKTHQLLKDFWNDVQQTKSDAILVAENTVETPKLATYFADVPMNFNFPLASAIVGGVDKGDATGIVSTIREMLNDYPAGAIDAPFLTNHDQTR